MGPGKEGGVSGLGATSGSRPGSGVSHSASLSLRIHGCGYLVPASLGVRKIACDHLGSEPVPEWHSEMLAELEGRYQRPAQSLQLPVVVRAEILRGARY